MSETTNNQTLSPADLIARVRALDKAARTATRILNRQKAANTRDREYRTLAPQLAEQLAETLKERDNCETCGGSGVMQVVVDVVAPTEQEIHAPEPCAHCDGDGRSGYAKLNRKLAEMTATVEQMREWLAIRGHAALGKYNALFPAPAHAVPADPTTEPGR